MPIWVIAVKVAPGSVALGRNSPTMRRCALELIGRNSVQSLDEAQKGRFEVTHRRSSGSLSG